MLGDLGQITEPLCAYFLVCKMRNLERLLHRLKEITGQYPLEQCLALHLHRLTGSRRSTGVCGKAGVTFQVYVRASGSQSMNEYLPY